MQVPPSDWLRVFWTLKTSFPRTFVESFKTLFTAARSCGPDYHRQMGRLVFVLEIRPSTLAGRRVKVRRSLDLVIERSGADSGGIAADDELAHAVMTKISGTLGWDEKSTVDWYAFALPGNKSDDRLIAIQVRNVSHVMLLPHRTPVRDNDNLKAHEYVGITTYQPDTKSNPNPNPNLNPTTKQHAIVNIELNIVTCPTYPEKFVRDTLLHRLYYLRLSSSHCHRTLRGLRSRNKSSFFPSRV